MRIVRAAAYSARSSVYFAEKRALDKLVSERLCLLGLAAGLQLAAHDVRVGAAGVDEVARGSGMWARRGARVRSGGD